MELSDSPTGQQMGGITNYFQGATIHNLVINSGTYTHSGATTNSYAHHEEQPLKHYTDEQIAEVIETINGKGKAIDSKKKMAGVYWYLRWAAGWPVSAQQFCNRFNALPAAQQLDFPCDYRNIREWATLSFMNEDARQMEKVRWSKNDEQVFYQCREVVLALEEAMKNMKISDKEIA